MFKTIYHVTNGPTVMYEIDARHALANFPEEWKETERDVDNTTGQEADSPSRPKSK
jgi:hypothetical protein